MPPHQLSTADRAFLEQVSRAVFANPFSDERAEADRRIIGRAPPQGAEARVDAALERIRAVLDRLEARHSRRAALLSVDDRALVRNAQLFDVFHRLIEPFDRLIQEQIAAGETSCRVAFAGEALALLAGSDLAPDESVRYFALFYQMRRAFYFIARTLIGTSPCMKHFRLALWNNVFTRDIDLYARHLWNRMEDFSTLLLGETGTGKGAAASAIGRSGFIPYDPRRQCFAESFMRSFLAVNLAQFPEPLLESELFGHRKGAFTGAVEAHDGILARCSPFGAIFLDEIGDVKIPVQIKLLKVLQERSFSPVGSHETRQFRGRVIAASNRPMELLRAQGTFRDDFFYRLCSDIIEVPTLRQRLQEDTGELAVLVQMMVQRIVGRTDDGMASLVLEAIRRDLGTAYEWPGNVRELEQCVRRILMTNGCRASRPHRAPALHAMLADGLRDGSLSAGELLGAYCHLLHQKHGTYEEVARRVALDRRTVRKYVSQGQRLVDTARNGGTVAPRAAHGSSGTSFRTSQ